ncbi:MULTISPECIES: NUDIX domain-containing protein [unclassified Streptomyces]|uniref:NUDIX domain-containing protein n=1 Tax=unclassified Streptomyces TaxID=2593676 RepID=UPI00343928FA
MYRRGCRTHRRKRLLTCPSGGCEPGEAPRLAARRKLAGEVGTLAADTELLTTLQRMPVCGAGRHHEPRSRRRRPSAYRPEGWLESLCVDEVGPHLGGVPALAVHPLLVSQGIRGGFEPGLASLLDAGGITSPSPALRRLASAIIASKAR